MDVDIATVMELLPIPGEPGKERKICDRIREMLLEMGVPADCISEDKAQEQSQYGGNTGNLFVRLGGHGRGERVMLSSHMDTVPGAVGSKPRLEEDRIANDAPDRALGADARAGCASVLAAARALMEKKGDHGPRTLVFFIQEEVGLVGARYMDTTMLGEPRPAQAFNFDGGDIESIKNQVIGTERLNINLTGVAAHAANPAAGISASEIEALAVAELAGGGWHGVIEKPEGRGTSNLGIVRGGTGSNVTMPELYALVEARSHDAAFRSRIVDEWKAAFTRAVDRANAKSPDVEGRAGVNFSPGPVYDPFCMDENQPVTRRAMEAIRKLGREPRLSIDNGGQDASWIVAHGIPCVGLGYGGRLAHSIEEHLDLEHFKLSCRLAVELAVGG